MLKTKKDHDLLLNVFIALSHQKYKALLVEKAKYAQAVLIYHSHDNHY